MTRKHDRIRGGFLGAAAGDALGYCVQEMTMEDISEQFGPFGIQGYDMLNGYAQISANTQMLLFTANGLLYGATRGAMRGVMAPYASYLRLAYRDWMTTQSYVRRGQSSDGRVAWLCCLEDLHDRRSPDRTTLLALEQDKVGTMGEPISRARGAAGLTRSIPAGMFLGADPAARQEAAQVAAEAAALTHGDPLGFLPAAYLANMLSRICHEDPASFRSIMHDAMEELQQQFGGSYHQTGVIADLLRQAEALAAEDLEPAQAMERLRPAEAHTVLAAACYVCLRFPGDFDRGIVAAVNHGYDSAAVGAVAGALLGASVGTEGIPEFYLEPLELRDILEEMADDLHQGCPMRRGNLLFDDQWNEKYVECSHESRP